MERIETMNNRMSEGAVSSGSTAVSSLPSNYQQQEEEECVDDDNNVEEEKGVDDDDVEIILTPAQVAADASSRNPSHGYNVSSSKKKSKKKKNVAIAYGAKRGGEEKSIFAIWFDTFIDMVAYVIARILNHPDVRDALSTAILEGAIKLFYVENLHDHIKNVDAVLTEHQVADAKKKGKDTTKIVKAYLGGVFNHDKDDDVNNVGAVTTEHQVADGNKKRNSTKSVKAYLGGMFNPDKDDK